MLVSLRWMGVPACQGYVTTGADAAQAGKLTNLGTGRKQVNRMNAPQRFDRSTEDVGNIVEFGHVNLRVPDQQLAIIFYVMGLGLTRDPYLVTGVDNAWMNVGTCQFHLPVGPAQVFRGVVGLVMPDLRALTERLETVRARLANTRFDFVAGERLVEVTCPWGNRIRIHAPDAAQFGAMVLGMPYVEVEVAPGTAPRIARFYAEVFAARASVGNDARGTFVRVPAGRTEAIVYRETRAALPAYDGHHIQIAVADFSGVHRQLLERGLVTEESSESQYRFQNIVDLDDSSVLATLEHEIRSMKHPLYARALVNRNPGVTNTHYASGHEAVAWLMPPE
jgi:catechol 2,3-dioxygenase-like lactoylglutathione lyase family enzyme